MYTSVLEAEWSPGKGRNAGIARIHFRAVMLDPAIGLTRALHIVLSGDAHFALVHF
ncbi:hypothetical protein JNK62_00560 [bacterium]|nr:hypothetical protein [bacterium]